MTALARTGLKFAVFFLALFALIFVALFVIFRSDKFHNWVQAELSRQSGSEVRVARLHFHPPLSIVADGVELSKPRDILFSASRITATINPFEWGSATVHRVDVENPVLQLDVRELTKPANKTAVKIALRQLNVQDGTIVLKKGDAVLLELPKINLSAKNLNLGGQAGVALHADVPQLNGEVTLSIKGEFPDLESEIVIRQKTTQRPASSSTSDGQVAELLRLSAKVHLPEKQTTQATIESKFDHFPFHETRITGTLNGEITIDPETTGAEFSASASLEGFPGVIVPAVSRLPSDKAAINFAGAYAATSRKLTIKSFRLASHLGDAMGSAEVIFDPQPTIANGKFILRQIPLETLKALLPSPLNRSAYRGTGQMEVDLHGAWDALEVKGAARGDGAQIRSDHLTLAKLSFDAPFAWSQRGLRVTGAKVIALKLAYGETNRWRGTAERMQVNTTVDYQASEPWKVSGQFETTGGKFSSPDNSKLGENLSLNGQFTITPRATEKSISVSGNVRAASGEVLWGKFFGDLKSQQPALDLDSRYFQDEDRFECRRCILALAQTGAVEVIGAIEHVTQSPALRLQARGVNFSPGGFFENFLRDNLKRQFPLLDRIDLGGQMTFQTQINGEADGLELAGELALKAGELRAKANDWQISGITLNLPFRVHGSGSKKTPAAKPRTGVMSIAKARFGAQALGPITTAISLSNNALQFPQPIRIGIFGGELLIGDLGWPDVVQDPKQVSFSIDMKRLQLQELTQTLDWPRFSGTLTGSIPEVQSVGNTLKTNGEINAELFGGQIRLGKLEIENPFSSLASIKLNAALDNVQLEQLSTTFAFGRISGILQGSIDDLVITDGQPSQFRADLHSVDRGTEQRISVEALNKITVLSSGENAGALYSGLAGFFDSFRYSKLGFKASLKNDRLTLRGVESQGDQEYLVVGSFLPPRVNIVSHTQVIAFSELLRRLEQIKSDKPEVK